MPLDLIVPQSSDVYDNPKLPLRLMSNKICVNLKLDIKTVALFFSVYNSNKQKSLSILYQAWLMKMPLIQFTKRF